MIAPSPIGLEPRSITFTVHVVARDIGVERGLTAAIHRLDLSVHRDINELVDTGLQCDSRFFGGLRFCGAYSDRLALVHCYAQCQLLLYIL